MIKLSGGKYRGRSIATPPGRETRPTQARLREALFSSIQFRIPESRVADLFAGSGALGFEALSRGAAHATFVESSTGAIRTIRRNMKTLGVEGETLLIAESVEKEIRSGSRLVSNGPYDIVFADPPYAAGWARRLVQDAPWNELLAEGGVFLLEWGQSKEDKASPAAALPDETPFLVKVREKNYGDTLLTTYERR